MIDEKKIEERANEEYPLQTDGHIIGRYAYKKGYKDAIQEFLKELWHPVEEEPKSMERVITHSEDDDSYKVITWTPMWHTWDGYKDIDHIDKWCYLDDLLQQQEVGKK